MTLTDAMLWAIFAIGAVGFCASLLLIFQAGAWFNRRKNVNPLPSPVPGLAALTCGISFLPLEIHASRFVPDFLFLFYQPLLLAMVLAAWAWLVRAEQNWRSPSNTPVNTDARTSTEDGLTPRARAGYWER
jgi:hypothetical protein